MLVVRIAFSGTFWLRLVQRDPLPTAAPHPVHHKCITSRKADWIELGVKSTRGRIAAVRITTKRRAHLISDFGFRVEVNATADILPALLFLLKHTHQHTAVSDAAFSDMPFIHRSQS